MEVRANSNFIRTAPRKVRLVADMIRGKKVPQALDILEFCKKWAKEPVLKLLKSAVANAAHNFNLQKENLFVKTIMVNQGPMLKRFTPKAFGRASSIQKKMSHVELVLGELKKQEEKAVAPVKEKIAAAAKRVQAPKSKVQTKQVATRQKKK